MFPTVHARTLADREVEFPAEVRGTVGLLFVAFAQDAQRQINSWMPLLTNYLSSKEVSYYELPMMEDAYRSAAAFIDGGMRRGVPPRLHDRTATYYGSLDAVFAALEITDNSKAYLFVLDRDGRIVFRVSDMATDDGVAKVTEVVNKLLGPGSPRP